MVFNATFNNISGTWDNDEVAGLGMCRWEWWPRKDYYPWFENFPFDLLHKIISIIKQQ
jgi:hypothetical protein